MKQISILIAFIIVSMISVVAQVPAGTGATLNYSAIEKKLQKSDQTIQDSKKGSDPKIWLERAKIFQDVFDVNTQLLRSSGMAVAELKLLYKEPKEIKKIEQGGSVIDQYVYDRILINVENGNVKSWE